MKVVLLLIATMGVSYCSACICDNSIAPVCATNGETYQNGCSLFCSDFNKRERCRKQEEICAKNPGKPCPSLGPCDFPQIQCSGPCPCVEPDKVDGTK